MKQFTWNQLISTSPGRLSVSKILLLMLMSIFLCTHTYAQRYSVYPSNGANVYSETSEESFVMGSYEMGEVINVISKEGIWASVNYKGKYGYIMMVDLKPYTDKNESKPGFINKVMDWLFDSEGEWWIFTAFKWILFIALIIFIIGLILAVIINVIVRCLILGLLAVVLGYILKWIGWIESDTIWQMVNWAGSAGVVWGVLHSILHPRETIDTAMKFSSDSSDNGGLKRYEVTCGGTTHTLTQNSKYSEINYVDEDGHDWEYINGTFYRK